MYTLLLAATFTTAPSNCLAVVVCRRLLQLLDRDLEVAEDQQQTALAAHLMVLDSLLDLQVRAGARVRGTTWQAHDILPHAYSQLHAAHCCWVAGPGLSDRRAQAAEHISFCLLCSVWQTRLCHSVHTCRLPGWLALSASTTRT